jgi:hypothetical protein
LNRGASLSAEQVGTAESILEQYDPQSLTEEDAKSIVSAFKEAGLEPGSDLRQTVREAGFNGREILELSGIVDHRDGSKPPPLIATGNQVNNEALEQLQDILSHYEDLGDLNKQEQRELNVSLYKAGLLEPGALVTARL